MNISYEQSGSEFNLLDNGEFINTIPLAEEGVIQFTKDLNSFLGSSSDYELKSYKDRLDIIVFNGNQVIGSLTLWFDDYSEL